MVLLELFFVDFSAKKERFCSMRDNGEE